MAETREVTRFRPAREAVLLAIGHTRARLNLTARREHRQVAAARKLLTLAWPGLLRPYAVNKYIRICRRMAEGSGPI
jgi:hypothetical protein